ncbi:glycosyltransferase involved in cell wall biosynthesis [Trinickia symbiotica]|uniref:Glycosyltransferase family 1 protein n=1 Tax=Trinickia symbiotica TaxID=863227 RepID=A0A2N7X5X9_9BURK|nr:glycosyltransferase family 1 protein [Trinickia symbiotica]PPK43024.1 glycosyltransferase involved in cell wall biosynthesis [Trinickia symbiotica]
MRLQFVIWNVVDYHVPRYRAVAQLATTQGYEISLIEIFGRSRAYGYPQVERDKFLAEGSVQAITLFKDHAHGEKNWLLVLMRLRKALRAQRPNIVVTLGYHTSYAIYLCAAKLLRRRFKLMYMSDSKHDDGKRFGLKEWFKKLLVSHFDGALVAGQRHRRYAQSLGIPLERSRVGFDVIDVGYFREAALRAAGCPAQARTLFGLPMRYVLCVSRFVERKNVSVVVEAFARSTLAHGGTSLVIVGQGPLEDAIRKKIDELGVREHVTILKEVLNRDMPSLYALADFLVLASAFDQWGLCVNEAMACGCPAIVSETCGCANELVHDGINGFVVRPGHIQELTDRMKQLGEDSDLRQHFAAAALSTIRNWTPALFAKNVLALADDLLRMIRPSRDEISAE